MDGDIYLISAFVGIGIALIYYFFKYILGPLFTYTEPISKYYLPEYVRDLEIKYPLLFEPNIIERIGEKEFLLDIKTDISKLIQNNMFYIYEERHIEKIDNNKYDVILQTSQYGHTILIMVLGHIYIDDVNKLKYNEGFHIEIIEECNYYADNGVNYIGGNNDVPYTIVCLKYDTIKIK